jgi:hypothetical protein
VVFLGKLLDGDFRMTSAENIDEMGFYTYEEAFARTLKPEAVFSRILTLWQRAAWPSETLYLGKY